MSNVSQHIMRSWSLANADTIASENKYTFYKPSPRIIDKIAPGEVVKLIFRFESNDPEAPAAERMWVLVDEVRMQGQFRGRLNNEPKHIKDLKLDDLVEFEACHIIDTEHDDHDNIVERYIKRCFVTERVLNEGERVGYLYREEPDDDNDSGWRITSNTESDDYMDDSANVAHVSLGAVLSRDDSFLHLLGQPAGSAFIRDAKTGQFVPCANEG
jgi:hypothetical protein